MATRREKLWAGLFVLLGAAAIGLSLALLAGVRFGGNDDDLYAVRFSESVAGLETRSVVRFNGVPLGRVRTIDLDPDHPGQVRVTIAIKKGSRLPRATVATLGSSGITGMLYVELSYTEPNHASVATTAAASTAPTATAPQSQAASAPATAPTSAPAAARAASLDYFAPGEVIPSRLSLLGQLADTLRDLFSNQNAQGVKDLIKHYDTLAVNANRLAVDANKKLDVFAAAAGRIDGVGEQTQELLANANRLIYANEGAIADGIAGAALAAKNAPQLVERAQGMLEANREDLRRAIASAAKLAAALQEKVAQERVTELVARLNDATQRANAVLAGVQSTVVANEQTLQETLANLRDATRSLRELSDRLRHDPALILRGRGGADKEIPDP